jgi:hypothetical protein
MTVEPRMLQPDLVGHVRRLQVQWTRLQQRDPLLVERPFDLDGHAEHILSLPQEACDLADLCRVEARLGGQCRGHSFGRWARGDDRS